MVREAIRHKVVQQAIDDSNHQLLNYSHLSVFDVDYCCWYVAIEWLSVM